jgi:heme/copper-type cytochrome/quinol oxidase subunit 2
LEAATEPSKKPVTPIPPFFFFCVRTSLLVLVLVLVVLLLAIFLLVKRRRSDGVGKEPGNIGTAIRAIVVSIVATIVRGEAVVVFDTNGATGRCWRSGRERRRR